MSYLYFEISAEAGSIVGTRRSEKEFVDYNNKEMSQINGKNFLVLANVVTEVLGENQGHGAPNDTYDGNVATRVIPAVDMSQEDIAARERDRKALSLSKLTVSVGNYVFDADEISLARMGNAILAASELGMTSHPWKLTDNSVAVITLADLKRAHAEGMQALGAIILS